MSFEQKIQSWVQIDNKIKNLNDHLKELRIQKTSLNENILDYAYDKQLQKSTINISDGKLKFINTTQTEPLTFKYIQKTLAEIISDPKQVDFIINKLKENRQSKTICEIKRYASN
jgi:hypothetical protein